MSMKVTILGSGTCVPRIDRNAASALVHVDSRCILVDVGPGTLRRLVEAGFELSDIDLLCLTHVHPDHVADLVPMIFAMKYPAGRRRSRPFHILAGEGFGRFWKGLRQVFGGWIELNEGLLRIHEMSVTGKDTIELEGIRFDTAPACHNPESVAFRLSSSSGACVVFSGDTDECATVVDLAQDADVLVLECAIPDEAKVDGHLTPSLAGRMATEARAKTLVLTHFYPECDGVDIAAQCRRTYAGKLLLARDLMVIQVPQ
ncbi:MAG: MBL fold metallo-hydrolase [Thermodesulfobacteriota bacterium]